MSVFGEKKGKREIEDVESGDRVYAVFEVRRDYITEGYFCMFQEAARVIAKDKDLTGEDHRVLRYLESILDIKNYISLSQTDIAMDLEIKQPNINRAIKNLLEKGIIIKGPKVGKSWTYILNANYAYKGRLKFLKQERKEHLKLIKEQKEERETEIEIKKNNKKKEKSEAERLIEKGEKTLF